MLSKALYFVVGAAVGAVVTYFVVNKAAQDRADAEINESLERLRASRRHKREQADEMVKENEARKEELLDKMKSDPTEDVPEMPPEDKEVYKKYASIVSRYGALKRDTINVITADEFGDRNFDDYYKQLGFTYYKDGTVANELNEELDWHEVEDTVGVDFMAYFRDNPNADICYVRNDKNRVDYEIQRVDDIYEATIDPSEFNESEGEE